MLIQITVDSSCLIYSKSIVRSKADLSLILMLLTIKGLLEVTRALLGLVPICTVRCQAEESARQLFEVLLPFSLCSTYHGRRLPPRHDQGSRPTGMGCHYFSHLFYDAACCNASEVPINRAPSESGETNELSVVVAVIFLCRRSQPTPTCTILQP